MTIPIRHALHHLLQFTDEASKVSAPQQQKPQTTTVANREHGNSVEAYPKRVSFELPQQEPESTVSHRGLGHRTEVGLAKLERDWATPAADAAGSKNLRAQQAKDVNPEDVLHHMTLNPGDRGPRAEQLQADLVATGFLAHAEMENGQYVFGPETQAAVMKWIRSQPPDIEARGLTYRFEFKEAIATAERALQRTDLTRDQRISLEVSISNAQWALDHQATKAQ